MFLYLRLKSSDDCDNDRRDDECDADSRHRHGNIRKQGGGEARDKVEDLRDKLVFDLYHCNNKSDREGNERIKSTDNEGGESAGAEEAADIFDVKEEDEHSDEDPIYQYSSIHYHQV